MTAMADKLGSYSEVYGPFIGIGSTRPFQYDMYLELKGKATEEELIRLTENDNPVIKAYAFNALEDRKSDSLLTVFERHLYDTSSFHLFSGCLSTPERINVYYLTSLKYSLGEKVFQKYRATVAAQYPEDCYAFRE